MTANSNKPQLGLLIQTLYSVILGISLTNLSILKLSDFYTSNTHNITSLNNRFQLVITAFTVLIAAHDWFTYHKNNSGESPKFKDYAFQMIVIFLIGLLFAFCKFEKIKEWYIVATIYTGLNIVNHFFWSSNTEGISKSDTFLKKYLLHIMLCIFGLIPVFGSVFFFSNLYSYYSASLFISIVLVLLSWFLTDNPETKPKEKPIAEAPEPFSFVTQIFTSIKGSVTLEIPNNAQNKSTIEKLTLLNFLKTKQVDAMQSWDELIQSTHEVAVTQMETASQDYGKQIWETLHADQENNFKAQIKQKEKELLNIK